MARAVGAGGTTPADSGTEFDGQGAAQPRLSEPAASGIGRTISNLDALLGVEEPSAAPAPGPMPDADPAAAEAAPLATAEGTASLSPEEAGWRQAAVQRRRFLSERRHELFTKSQAHARSMAWHQEQLIALQQQCWQLDQQTAELEERLDPEAAAASRQLQEEEAMEAVMVEVRDQALMAVTRVAVLCILLGSLAMSAQMNADQLALQPGTAGGGLYGDSEVELAWGGGGGGGTEAPPAFQTPWGF